MKRLSADVAISLTKKQSAQSQTLHGWTQTDFPIYNKEAAERHWTELTSLYQRTLS